MRANVEVWTRGKVSCCAALSVTNGTAIFKVDHISGNALEWQPPLAVRSAEI